MARCASVSLIFLLAMGFPQMVLNLPPPRVCVAHPGPYSILRDASEEARADRQIVLEAVTQLGADLQFASLELRADKEVVVEALQCDSQALEFASEELRSDKEVVGQAIGSWSVSALEFSGEAIRSDKEFMLEAVMKNWEAMKYASNELLSDAAFVVESAELNGDLFKYASMELRGDRAVVLSVTTNGCCALQHTSDELRADKNFVLEVVKHFYGAWQLRDVSLELRADRQVVWEAVKRSGDALQYADEPLRADKDLALEALDHCLFPAFVLESVAEQLRADREVVLKAVKQQDGTALQYAAEQLRADKDLVMEAVKRDGRNIRYASDSLRADQALQLLAARRGAEWQSRVPEDRDNYRFNIGRRSIHFQVDLGHIAYTEVIDNHIAVPGEEAPIVTVSLTYAASDPEKRKNLAGTFGCEAAPMSAPHFNCSIPDGPSIDEWGNHRPRPILGMLAENLVETIQSNLQKHPRNEVSSSKAANRRVFINLVLNDNGDTMTVTPWDWERPLTEFLPTKQQGEEMLEPPKNLRTG